MKTILFAAMLMSAMSTHAVDLAEKHQTLCESTSVKSIRGETGSCHIVLAMKRAAKINGTCSGKFFGSMPCKLSYASDDSDEVNLHLICGHNPTAPVISQKIPAKTTNYSVSAIINGESVVHDVATHSYIESAMVNLTLSSSPEKKEGSITLMLQFGPAELSDVVCE